MELAKPGEIHGFCRPNGILTFAEYLEDYSQNGIYEKGYAVLNHYLEQIQNTEIRKQTEEKMTRVKNGERDLFF